MQELSTPVLSGLAVLFAGVLAFIVVTHAPPGNLEEAKGAPAVEAPSTYTNLGPSVEKALVDSGQAWIQGSSELLEIPGSVARVLDTYQAPLMIPVEAGT